MKDFRDNGELGLAIKHVSHMMSRKMSEKSPEGLTGMQCKLLMYISNRGEDTYQRDVEKHFEIRRSSVTGALQLLEKKGFIRREAVENDARLKRLVLTDRAQKLCGEMRQAVDGIEYMLRSRLTSEEIESFFEIMNKIAAGIDSDEELKMV